MDSVSEGAGIAKSLDKEFGFGVMVVRIGALTVIVNHQGANRASQQEQRHARGRSAESTLELETWASHSSGLPFDPAGSH